MWQQKAQLKKFVQICNMKNMDFTYVLHVDLILCSNTGKLFKKIYF